MKEDLVKAFDNYGVYPFLSGGGSTLDYTVNIRKHLPIIFAQFGVNTFLDAPCGSLEWMATVLDEMPNLNYIGADIVKNIVDHHTETYKDYANRNFIHLDITEDALPDADMWMVRDCFFHLPHGWALSTLENFLKSNIKYILTTSHVNGINSDIKPGEFGMLNLFASPFNFPEPLYRLEDWVDDAHHSHLRREMCVWSREQIAELFQGK